MAKTEAQKKAQRDFMARGNWKKISIMARTEDCDLLKKMADAAGLPVSTYIKRAISAQSGVSFSWDEKQADAADAFPMNPPEVDKSGES